MTGRTLLVALTASGAALFGCAEDAPPAITVGPVSYSEEELLGLTESRRQSLADLASLALAVSDSSTTELGAPLVAQWTDDRLIDILAAELTLEEHGVAEATLLDEYRADPVWELTLRHILVFSERWREASHRSAAEQKAARARALLLEGVDFAEVEARLVGEPGGEARAGLLPPGREGAWVPEFWRAALALDPGALSPVTETQYGFHVLRLEAREVVPFPEARSAMARQVARALEDPRAVLDAWTAARATNEGARREAALAEAHARGLEVPAGERAEITRRWDDQVATWTGAFGFAYGQTPARIAEAALAALAATGQGAEIARRELAVHSELLRGRHEVLFGTASVGEP